MGHDKNIKSFVTGYQPTSVRHHRYAARRCDSSGLPFGVIRQIFSIISFWIAALALSFMLLSETARAGSSASIFGTPGIVAIPTADFYRDGNITGGVNFISKERLNYSKYQYDGLVTFATLSFLPYVEMNLKFTKQLGRPARSGHTVDRSPSIRLKLLNEKRRIPAIVFGVHDVLSTVDKGNARHFGATYLVFTKHFVTPDFMIVPTLGYGFDALNGREKELVGIFGGARLSYARMRPVSFLIDYDTRYLNIGFDLFPTRYSCIKVGWTNFRYFVAGASMQINLFDVF